MTKILFTLLFCGSLVGQISAPRIGFVRDLEGALRPIHGVAGAFVLGDAVVQDVVSANFPGPSGCAQTSAGALRFTDGKVEDNDTLQECPAQTELVTLDGDSIVIAATGGRLRAPAVEITGIEQVAEEWFVLRSEKRLFLVRTVRDREAIYELPESTS